MNVRTWLACGVLLSAIALGAACQTRTMKVPQPIIPEGPLPVMLPEGIPGSAAATEALLPKIVEHYCLERLIDGAPESYAAGKAGLTRALNPVHAVDGRFPREAWSTAETPRLFVWPSISGGAGCTIAVFEGDLTRTMQIVGDATEAGSSRRGGRTPKAFKTPSYEEVRPGWMTFFAPGGDGRVFSAFASHDNPDPVFARGVLLTLSELDK